MTKNKPVVNGYYWASNPLWVDRPEIVKVSNRGVHLIQSELLYSVDDFMYWSESPVNLPVDFQESDNK